MGHRIRDALQHEKGVKSQYAGSTVTDGFAVAVMEQTWVRWAADETRLREEERASNRGLLAC